MVESLVVPCEGAPPQWLLDWVALGVQLSDIASDQAGSIGEEMPLRAVRQLRASLAQSVDHLECELIADSRENGASWRHIADALGVGTPQAAHQHFLRVSRRVKWSSESGSPSRVGRRGPGLGPMMA